MQIKVQDQIKRLVEVPKMPDRIISLVPSLTDILHFFELENETIGITKFCVHPQHWLKEKVVIGGTKNPNIDLIQSLSPNLILANKEENNKEDIERLAENYPVWVSDVVTLQDQQELISKLGVITNRIEKAIALNEKILTAYQNIQPSKRNCKVLYLIWRKPWMAAGGNTFINSVLHALGFDNATLQQRYPELTNEQIKNIDPDVVLLSSEPFPFQEKHIEELNNILPHAKIELVDGEVFSWYGPRQLQLPELWDQLKSKII